MRIGFVNGCFDTFHEGHRHLLRECLARCDYLIVAINSDASVKRLKGHDRPRDNWTIRALNAAAEIKFSGAVIPFEGDEGPLLMTIRPDILFKGYDHSPLPWFYRRIGWKKRPDPIFEGPKVIQISHLHGYSTTEILKEREDAS